MASVLCCDCEVRLNGVSVCRKCVITSGSHFVPRMEAYRCRYLVEYAGVLQARVI